MSLCLGALYAGRDFGEVQAAWQRRLLRQPEKALALKARADARGQVWIQVAPRPGRRVEHRVLGALVRQALGPEREERAEFWLLEPATAAPGALRLDGADWDDCLVSIAQESARQVRLWSPLVCPASLRRSLQQRGRALGLEWREADCWAVLAVPRPKPKPPYPAPWRGNYGW